MKLNFRNNILVSVLELNFKNKEFHITGIWYAQSNHRKDFTEYETSLI